MTTGGTGKSGDGMGAIWGWLALSLINFVVGHWWPDSLAATVFSRVLTAYIVVWVALRIRRGYLLRKPHWTRESWLRYLRLATPPLVAVAFVLYISSFDPVPVLGARGSAMRLASVITVVLMLILGAGGVGVAIEWLVRGEPSQQFTRTRWFQRQRPNLPVQ